MNDFNKGEIDILKGYGGSQGKKINLFYNNKSYMLKFSGLATYNKDMSYSNSSVSEHISCEILKSIGFSSQNTLLGIYTTDNNTEKLSVACEDFTYSGKRLLEFSQLKNSIITSSSNGYGTELDDVLLTIREQKIIDTETLKDFFWDMFIADALIGNFDRHNGNWGFLIDDNTRVVEIAPIYDCGSALYPQLDNAQMENVINNESEINIRIYKYPQSALKIDGAKINYFSFISSLENKDCNAALKRIIEKVDMNKIETIIKQCEYISDIQKTFFVQILTERKEKILDYSLNLLLSKELNSQLDDQKIDNQDDLSNFFNEQGNVIPYSGGDGLDSPEM